MEFWSWILSAWLGIRGFAGAGIFLGVSLLGGAVLDLVTGYAQTAGAARPLSGSAAALY
jgi:hypothetical protein